MSDNAIRCGLDGCTSRQCASPGAHSWTSELAIYGTTGIPGQSRYLSIWLDIDDRDRRPNEILLGLYNDRSGEHGTEAWMTVAEAEEIVHLLGSAIRRHTAYRAASK